MKKLVILIVIVVVAVLAWWALGDKQEEATPNAQDTSVVTEPTTATEVSTELEGLGDADLDAEMQAIDADLKAL